MNLQINDKIIVFLDTIPFLFLFSKNIESLNKTIAEVLYISNYCFFTPSSCWTIEHSRKWENICNISNDFKNIDYVNTFYHGMYNKIDEYYLKEISNNYWEKYLDFFEKVKKIRALFIGKDRPNNEEIENILLAMLIESNNIYDCKTRVILGDDKHTKILANLFKDGMHIDAQFLVYPFRKILTLIDFFKEDKIKDSIPENIILNIIFLNYSKFKVSNIDKNPIQDFIQNLPIYAPRRIPSTVDKLTFIEQFVIERDLFAQKLLKLTEYTIMQLIHVFFIVIYESKEQMIGLQKKIIYDVFYKDYKLLVESFYYRYESSFNPSYLNLSIEFSKELKNMIEDYWYLNCKNITLDNRFNFP